MNRYEFENLLSDYLDGSMPFNKKKEFEHYMEKNPDAQYLLKNIRNTVLEMKKIKQLKVSENFNDKLLSKVKTERMLSVRDKKTLFGFTPFYASVFSCLCIALFVVASQLFNFSENSDRNINSYQYSASKKENPTVNMKNKSQENKNLMVDSKIDSVNKNLEGEKQVNPNNIKFVNY